MSCTYSALRRGSNFRQGYCPQAWFQGRDLLSFPMQLTGSGCCLHADYGLKSRFANPTERKQYILHERRGIGDGACTLIRPRLLARLTEAEETLFLTRRGEVLTGVWSRCVGGFDGVRGAISFCRASLECVDSQQSSVYHWYIRYARSEALLLLCVDL